METYKIVGVIVAFALLLMVKPIVNFCTKEKFETYKDVLGNDVKVKTRGYIKR